MELPAVLAEGLLRLHGAGVELSELVLGRHACVGRKFRRWNIRASVWGSTRVLGASPKGIVRGGMLVLRV